MSQEDTHRLKEKTDGARAYLSLDSLAPAVAPAVPVVSQDGPTASAGEPAPVVVKIGALKHAPAPPLRGFGEEITLSLELTAGELPPSLFADAKLAEEVGYHLRELAAHVFGCVLAEERLPTEEELRIYYRRIGRALNFAKARGSR